MNDKPLTNNPPFSILELTEAQHLFLLKNCSVNMTYILGALQNNQRANIMSRPELEVLVKLMENFKEIRTLLKVQHPEVDEG